MNDIYTFLQTLKKHFNVKTNLELAEILNCSKGQIDRWASSNKMPKKQLERIKKQISMNESFNNFYGDNNNFYTNNYTTNISSCENTNSQLEELIILLKQYGNQSIYNEIRDRLLQIKEISEKK